MSRNVLVAVGGAIVGALIVFFYIKFIPPIPIPTPGPCAGSNPHCLVVSVITVNGQPQIAQIPDHPVHDQGAAIFWEIGSQGYSFPETGIAFNKQSAPTPTGEFACAPVNTRTFKCIDAYHTKGTFGYTITLEGSPQAPPLDPFIVNN
jgi:hypothetical protein